MKQKFSLDETWRLCLNLWRWVVRQIEAGNKLDVQELKAEWCKKHGFEDIDILENCFFCEYKEKRNATCSLCPARKIDKNFYCTNKPYRYYTKPIKFFKEITRLNKIRLGK